MTADTRANSVRSLIDRYNALSVADQRVLQVLSALYEPVAATFVYSCLVGAGCRESLLRVFSAQDVAIRLARLAKAGFVLVGTRDVGGRKIRFWSCYPAVAEIAIRHSIRDGLFFPFVKTLPSEAAGRDGEIEAAVDSPRRRFRLSFHAGDWHAAVSLFPRITAENPGHGGAFLAEIISLQPDHSWRRDLESPVFSHLLCLALADSVAGLSAPEPLSGLARELLEKGAPDHFVDEALPILSDLLAFRGKYREIAKIAALARGDAARSAVSVAPVPAGDRVCPSVMAGIAAAACRARPGAKEFFLPGMGVFWQILTLLEADNRDELEAMLRRLSSPAAQAHPLAGVLSSFRYVILFMSGQAAAASLLPNRPPDKHPLTVIAHALAMLRVDPKRLPSLVSSLKQQAEKAWAGGYRWLAGKFQTLVDIAAGENLSKERREDVLIRLFYGDDAWRRVLRTLEELAAEPDAVGEQAGKRLAWLVLFPRRPANHFVPFEIQPVEQSLAKNGIWSKGRNIALRRIVRRSPDLSFATPQDHLVFSTLCMEFDGYNYGYRFEASASLPFLVGHPLVYRGDAGGAKLDVEAGEFELLIEEREGGYEISLAPALSEFLPIGAPDLSAYSSAGALPETAARLETPTRLRIFRLGERERRLVMALGEGLVVPARGREETLRVLSRLSGRIRVHSDIPGLAGEAESVEADVRPRFHIIPQTPGLKVEVWCHPLGDDGPAYRPGSGGRLLTAEVNGRTVRANRSSEREISLAEEAVRACPSLTGRADGDLSWRLEDPEEALSFLAETEELAGKAILVWPKGGRFRVRRLAGPGGLSLKVNSTAEWFEVTGGLKVDEDIVVDMNRLLAAMPASKGRFVEIGEGEYLALTGELRRQLADLEALGEFHGGLFRLSALAGGMLEELEESGASLTADAEWRRRLDARRHLADFSPEPPADFRAGLRNYQLVGYRWLARLAEWGVGACLADDMGLGKTIQALAMLVRRGDLGPALVVAPTSVCHNWMAEAGRFAPGLRMLQLGGGDRKGLLASLGPREVLITSYSLLRQEEILFAGVKWATAVLDEAQAIKNVAAKRSRAAMSLDAGFRLITTGTPIENHLGELWNLFRFINPRLLGSWRKFQERFAVPIERGKDGEAGERLRRVIRPFILRRTKAQVLQSLPPKTEITLAVELGEKERAFYESLRRSAVERLESESGNAAGRRFRILAEIMRLRRVCCSPELIAGNAGIPSAKQEQFRITLADLLENGHKTLVFSQFVDHLSIIRRYLDQEGLSYQYLDGSTPAKGRKRAVDAFQGGVGDVFLISLKAGGLGLNLTAADYVIHMDPWWNPAVEDQASDRVHRIGQEKPVTVYRLVAANTIEEKIVQLHRDKRDLADSLLSGADQAAGLDIEEIMRLLRE
ncbi:MAG: DEAD/DEAH box helicase [Planctomycetes bacterium]|nr:DEAD/DEAH box helicase [Planctomycetota bacterium]